jgi:hypothetical protein
MTGAELGRGGTMKKNVKKLQLSRETLRFLTGGEPTTPPGLMTDACDSCKATNCGSCLSYTTGSQVPPCAGTSAICV